MRGTFAAIGAAAVLMCGAGTASAGTLDYAFDGGASQGWQVSGSQGGPRVGALANPGGGNPGGALFFNDLQADESATFYSPSFPAGSLAPNYGGTLSFDLKIAPSGVDTRELSVFINSPTESILTRFAHVPGPAFQTYAFPLQARVGSDYVGPGGIFSSPASESRWRSVLATATEIEVMFDAYWDAGDNYTFDNLRVTEPPVVPGPIIAPETPAKPKPKCKKRKKGKKPRKRCKRKKKRR